jgi:16S rRNA (adenine1518-N6/adenine1519-N6)-dimethyltransferase
MKVLSPNFPRPKKSFGQNFLHDRHVIHKIIEVIQPKPDDFMVEIGPGRGALTLPLLDRLNQLYAIELDRDLIALLEAQGLNKLHLLGQDVLSVDWARLALCIPEKKMRIVGNLPYNISTPILFQLLAHKDLIQDMYFMLQKEVVARICAAPNSKTYGRLSVMIQVNCEAVPLLTIQPGAFTPAPQVDSMILQLKPYASPKYHLSNPERFAEIVKLAFQSRRKTLKNALKGFPDLILPEAFKNKRAEQLYVSDFVELSQSS